MYKSFFCLFLFSVCGCAQELQNNKSDFLTTLVKVVEANHLAPKVLDNELSKQIFNAFLQKIDSDKKIFSLQEIEKLKSFEEKIDDELKEGSTDFFNKTIEIYTDGIVRAETYAMHFLETDIDPFKEEYLEINSEQNDFIDKNSLKKHWGLLVKKQFLDELYLIEIVDQELTFEEQKEKALEKTKTVFRNYFHKIKSQERDELMEMYANAYLSCNDYQSGFLSPENKAAWTNKFNRSFVGVGMSIETSIDYPIITEVSFDGPAWKTNKINKGDVLMKISDDQNQLIDVAGFPVKKVIDLLKGEKGSSVNLRIKNQENEIADVVIERGQVLMTQTMSFILENQTDQTRVGYIYLPRFYIGGEGAASHVLRELRRLNKEKIDAVIFDLRNNQGGSATEAVEMIGYFLKGGTVMQTLYADGDLAFREDQDESAQYLGKVVVMVNERSSSASELFAGTLQDYNRAIIVGNQTFGKGTVQGFIPIISEQDSVKYGEVKLSRASFYTGNGRSTQYNGIVPDIPFSSENKYLKTGERAVENALIFDDLEPTVVSNNEDFIQTKKQLKLLSENRQAESEYFQSIEANALLKKEREEKSLLSLNYKEFKVEKEKMRKVNRDHRQAEKLSIHPLSFSKTKVEKEEYWNSKLLSDAYLYESMLIVKDYLKIDG